MSELKVSGMSTQTIREADNETVVSEGSNRPELQNAKKGNIFWSILKGIGTALFYISVIPPIISAIVKACRKGPTAERRTNGINDGMPTNAPQHTAEIKANAKTKTIAPLNVNIMMPEKYMEETNMFLTEDLISKAGVNTTLQNISSATERLTMYVEDLGKQIKQSLDQIINHCGEKTIKQIIEQTYGENYQAFEKFCQEQAEDDNPMDLQTQLLNAVGYKINQEANKTSGDLPLIATKSKSEVTMRDLTEQFVSSLNQLMTEHKIPVKISTTAQQEVQEVKPQLKETPPTSLAECKFASSLDNDTVIHVFYKMSELEDYNSPQSLLKDDNPLLELSDPIIEEFIAQTPADKLVAMINNCPYAVNDNIPAPDEETVKTSPHTKKQILQVLVYPQSYTSVKDPFKFSNFINQQFDNNVAGTFKAETFGFVYSMDYALQRIAANPRFN